MESFSSSQVRDLGSVRPKLREPLRFLFQEFKGQTYCIIEDCVSSKFHRVGLTEYHFIRKLNGQYTFTEAHAISSAEAGKNALTEAEATSVLSWLVEQHLVELGGDIPQDRLTDVRSKRTNSGIRNVLNLLFIRVPIGSPNHLLDRIPLIRSLLCSRPFFILWVAFLSGGIYSVLLNWDRLVDNAEGILSRSNWFWLLAVWVLLKVWHEFWHAITCRHYGGAVRECGVLFVLFAPLGYVDATSSLAFDSKWQRIRVALAGIYGEFFIAAIAAIVWSQTSPGLLNTVAHNTVIMASTVTLLFNLNPLMRFDGYYVLTEWIEIPNLASRSSSLLRSLGKVWFLGVDGIRMPDFRDSETWIFLGYGVAALMWRVLIMVTLTVAASVLFGGGGQLLSVIAITFWLMPMLGGLINYIHGGHPQERPSVPRAYLRLTLAAVVIALLSIWPVRPEALAPGALQFSEEKIYRAETDGFLVEAFVESGDPVLKDEPLFRLSNVLLKAEHKRLKVELGRQSIRQRWARVRQSPAEFAAEQARFEALQQRVEANQKQYDALRAYASGAGVVAAPRLAELNGQYIKEGQPVLSVIEQSDLNLAIAISQQSIDISIAQLGQRVDVFFLDIGQSATGRLARIDGRATRTIEVPELTQVGGGPLAIVSTGSDTGEAELVEPVFMGEVEIPNFDSASLRPGQRALVRFEAERPESLFIHTYNFLWNTIHSILRTAQRASSQGG